MWDLIDSVDDFTPDLMWNEIGASGATAMIGLLEKNHSLTELKLAGNNIPCQLLGQIGIQYNQILVLLIY